MRANGLLAQLRGLGVKLTAVGGRLEWAASKGIVNQDLRTLIAAKKSEIVRELRCDLEATLIHEIAHAASWDDLSALCEKIDTARLADQLSDVEVNELCDRVREQAGVIPETLSGSAKEAIGD